MGLLFCYNKSILITMEYILFAFLALLASAGNTLFNRLGVNRASALTNAVIKSFFIVIACFLIALAFGHVPALYSIDLESWIWIGVIGVLTSVDWFFYFLAIKRSHLEAFAPFCTAGILFTSNLLFSIFMFMSVTNGGKPLNIVFYFIGLACLLAAVIYVVLNKKINPKTKLMWVLFGAISVISFSFVLLIVKLKLSHIPSDVVSFHQMCIVFLAMLVASISTRSIKEIVHIRWIDHLYIFLGAVCNALMIVARYTAFSFENSVPAIVNVIIGLDFIIVSVATVLFFKAKNKLVLTCIIILIATGMVLNLLAGLI